MLAKQLLNFFCPTQQPACRGRTQTASTTLLLLASMLGTVPCQAQSASRSAAAEVFPAAPEPQAHAEKAEALGSVRGDVVDPNGNAIPGASVQLAITTEKTPRHAAADGVGHYDFADVPAGPFELTVTAPAFAARSITGKLLAGEWLTLPDTALPMGIATTEVHVTVTQVELAQEQIRDEEKQRVLGVIPNFYVAYGPDTLPLTTRQKYELALKTSIDPVSLASTGVTAGIQQATNAYSGYGQGTQGYARRFGASYADGTIGDFLGNAVLPSLFKQDPRYFYKGSGTVPRRFLYAVSMAVMCKGDNGRWQVNYSGILGSLAAGGISNHYYPDKDRSDAALTFENFGIGVGSAAIANLFQEFLVKKLTPHARKAQTSLQTQQP